MFFNNLRLLLTVFGSILALRSQLPSSMHPVGTIDFSSDMCIKTSSHIIFFFEMEFQVLWTLVVFMISYIYKCHWWMKFDLKDRFLGNSAIASSCYPNSLRLGCDTIHARSWWRWLLHRDLAYTVELYWVWNISHRYKCNRHRG